MTDTLEKTIEQRKTSPNDMERLPEQFPGIQFIDVPDRVMQEFKLDELPRGIAVVGGAARAILQRVEFDESAPVRDVDLVAIVGRYSGDQRELDRLSAVYMPDDYFYGNGVGCELMDGYFATRDFTLNEVLVVDGRIIVTAQGYGDLKNKVVRPTEYEASGWWAGVGPKLAATAVLMETLFQHEYGVGSREGIDDSKVAIDDFHFALAYNKALQYGDEVARRFLQKFGYDPDGVDLVEVGCELAWQTDFTFRGSTTADRIARLTNRQGGDTREYWTDLPGSSAFSAQEEKAIGLLGRYAGRHAEVYREYR